MDDVFKNMFREYDIRGKVDLTGELLEENEKGIVPREMTRQNVARIAKGFATFLSKRNKPREIIVGYDNRSYSPGFAKAAIESLVNSGFKVYDIGLVLTPVTYFTQYFLNCPSAIMITASHNPNGWSGLKLAHDYSQTLGPDELQELYKIIVSEKFIKGPKGSVNKRDDIQAAYINFIAKRIHVKKETAPKIVIDAGNGAAGLFAYELFERIGCLTFLLNCDPDVTYPHYDPNPSNLKARERLKEIVTHERIRADLGIGFDGDGDRIGVIDRYGENIWSDKILMILAKQLLEKKPGSTIVFDVKCSQGLFDIIEKYHGKSFLWKTGHSHIKSKMRETGAALAGERSGHIFIGGYNEDNDNGYYGYDDAIFAGAKLVEYISTAGKSFSEILKELPQYFTSPEIKAHCADSAKYDVVNRIVREFKQDYPGRVIDINGARVIYKNGWGLVRASSNLPELSIVFEGKTKEAMMKIRQDFKKRLGKYKEIKEWENDIVD